MRWKVMSRIRESGLSFASTLLANKRILLRYLKRWSGVESRSVRARQVWLVLALIYLLWLVLEPWGLLLSREVLEFGVER